MRMTIRQKKMAMSNLALALDKCMKKQLDKPAVATHLPAAQVFNQQRRDLMKLHTNNVMAIEVLHSYLMQLKAIVEVFPVSKGGLDVDFQWHNSFEDADFAKQASVAFEEAAVFFNMGAVLTTLASLSTRGTADGLKVSHGYFRNAVAIYSHLRRTLAPMLVKPLTNDLCPEGLDLCHATCVAQAQECFYERACMLSSNLALRAKIAAGSATCYKTMLRCSKPAGTLSKQLHPTWRIFASFGVCIYQASSCYEMGASMYPIAPADDLEAEVTCPDDSKVGEALGYLQSAQRHLDAAKKELKAFDKYVKDPELHKKAVDLEELLSRHLRITTSDNQVVYFQKGARPSSRARGREGGGYSWHATQLHSRTRARTHESAPVSLLLCAQCRRRPRSLRSRLAPPFSSTRARAHTRLLCSRWWRRRQRRRAASVYCGQSAGNTTGPQCAQR